jgi:hypothetical protein
MTGGGCLRRHDGQWWMSTFYGFIKFTPRE